MQKQRFYLYRRKGVFYIQDSETGAQKSLDTRDSKTAKAVFQAKVQAQEQPMLNMAVARAHLAAIDPRLAIRKWSDLMSEYVGRCAKESTRERNHRAIRSMPFNLIREKKLVETTADDLRAVMAAGGVFTNHFLRCMHNLAQGLGWLPWPIIPPKLWPSAPSKPKRAITPEEHHKIVQAEQCPERKLYYAILWETGAAQSDGAGCHFIAEWFARGKFRHYRTDWLIRLVDNHRTRLEVLEVCDEHGCQAIIAANEMHSSEAYYYRRQWKDTLRDPRIYYSELNTDRSGDPRAASIGCTGEVQQNNRQLVSANLMAAALAEHLFVLWHLKAPRMDKETVELLPHRFAANLSKLETHRLKGGPHE